MALLMLFAQNMSLDTNQELSALYLSRGCNELAVHEMEKSIVKHFQSSLTWWSLALTCIHAKDFSRALLALKESDYYLQCEITNKEKSVKKDIKEDETLNSSSFLSIPTQKDQFVLSRNLVLLMASKVCLKHTNQYIDGIRYAQVAVDVAIGGFEKIQALTMIGIGYISYFRRSQTSSEREDCLHKAMDHLLHALKIFNGDGERGGGDIDDSIRSRMNDYDCKRIYYHLALVYAEMRDIDKAIEYTRSILSLDGFHTPGWNLLALLITSNKQYNKALDIVNHGLNDSPNDVQLLLTKASIEKILFVASWTDLLGKTEMNHDNVSMKSNDINNNHLHHHHHAHVENSYFELFNRSKYNAVSTYQKIIEIFNENKETIISSSSIEG